ncbi:MAG TPA: lipoate--protein ligase family protein [Gemmataceae bacterium]|nr:lipoate--protein ligase family protein [Gemmataceae bacterium]
MQFLELTLPTLAENLALDEALLLQCEAGDGTETLRVWEWRQPAVVLGAAGMLTADVDEAACNGDGVQVSRRASGGGTVLLGPGCLLYSLVLSYDGAPELKHIGPSYCHIFNRIRQSLAVPELGCAGVSDLAIAGLKVSGNAQQRKRNFFLHHGTLLYAFDVGGVQRYLRMPARQPAYREQRPHGGFMRNLPLTREEIVARLRKAFDADHETTAWPKDLVGQLVATKYSLPEWTRRR